MLYYTELEKLVLDEQLSDSVESIAIISGYVGIDPIKKLAAMRKGKQCIIIYGMYGEEKIDQHLHDALLGIQNKYSNLDIRYSQIPVHSKLYFWDNDNEMYMPRVLIGSANFSVNGLTNDYREVLADAEKEDQDEYIKYFWTVYNNSISCKDNNVIFKKRRQTKAEDNDELELNSAGICRATLLDNKNEVPEKSGLNWCLANGHVSEGDAYIKISTKYLKNLPGLFPPKKYASRLSNPDSNKRENDQVDLIWDDGTTMVGLLEGQQTCSVDGLQYPKQISSSPDKSIIGLYLRKRLGVSTNHKITKSDLLRYGRTHIDISLIGEGIYYMDFSVKNK